MKEFLILGGYSGGNPGDEAILKSTIRQLQGLFSDVKFYILSDQKRFYINFDWPVDFEMIYWNDPLQYPKNEYAFRIWRRIYSLLFPFSRWTLAILTRSTYFKDKMQNIDAVILVGGGYLTSFYSIENLNYTLYTLKNFKVPLYLLGQTLGPFTKRKHVRMASEIFKQARIIILRDSASLPEVRLFQDKVHLAADDAILFSPQRMHSSQWLKKYFPAGDPDQWSIGLNLRRWKDSRDSYPAIAEKIIKVIAQIPGERVKLVFIPMETGSICDDREEAKIFAQFLPTSIDYKIVVEDLTVEDRYQLISQCRIFIGMRLHSLVFALSAGIPTIGLYHDEYYARKISGLFETFDLSEYALSLNEIDSLEVKMQELIQTPTQLKNILSEQKNRIVQQQMRILKAAFQE